jgi:integrase
MRKSDHLWQRGRQYWFRLAIPPSLRHHFPSGGGHLDKVAKPLGDSPSLAKVCAAEEAAEFLKLFARLRAGEQVAPKQIEWMLKRRLDPLEPMTYVSDDEWREFIQGPPTQRQKEFAQMRAQKRNERIAKMYEDWGNSDFEGEPARAGGGPETISQAAEAWIAELTRQDEPPRPQTLDGHRNRVRVFIRKRGDKPLAEYTRAEASDFLRSLAVAGGTRNAYATTLKCIFDDARNRGRFTGENPFDGMKVKKGDNSYVPFTIDELQTLFDALPLKIDPIKHTPSTALPWAAAIALYSGARLEEIAQLTTADIRSVGANGATVTVIDIHNGGTNKLKNESSARIVPVHSALVRAGLLDYVKVLPKGSPLFPGLKRRASKGGKIGARLGELFRKRLVALGLKRRGLCFHSFRHTVAGRLDAAEARQSDVARILGHAVAGMSLGTYSKEGPGLKVIAGVVEKIDYPGLRLRS